jgi:16S rRNA (guanine527-N7)-methyltransferase
MLESLYNDWNAKINVISRKDIQNLYEHHVLHSLGIAKVVNFREGTTVMDLGTGGGFPGIPLAILFPKAHFHLVDSVGKKIKVAQEVAEAIGLKNVEFSHIRAEEIKTRYDFVVTRAVMPLVDLMKVARKNIAKEQHNAVPNGIIALKGGKAKTKGILIANIVFSVLLSSLLVLVGSILGIVGLSIEENRKQQQPKEVEEKKE